MRKLLLFSSVAFTLQLWAVFGPCALRISQETQAARKLSAWSSYDPIAELETPRLRMEIHAQSKLRKVVKIYTKEGVELGEFYLRWDSADSGGMRVGPLSVQREGYATEARFYLTKYMYDHYPFKQMTAVIQTENAASIALHKKLGFFRDLSSASTWVQSVEDFRLLEQ